MKKLKGEIKVMNNVMERKHGKQYEEQINEDERENKEKRKELEAGEQETQTQKG